MVNTGPASGARSGSRQTFHSQLQEKAASGMLSAAGISPGGSPLCQALGVPDFPEFPAFSGGSGPWSCPFSR